MIVTHEIEMNDDYLDVEFDCDLAKENSGIGSYEYWGFKEYDKGVDYMIAEEIMWDKALFTEDQNKFIEQWLMENYSVIEREAIEKYYEYIKDAF
jgi:hypothetical protein